ncbi:MAG: Rpp14/Pop5 family protein [Halorientalis sp.]
MKHLPKHLRPRWRYLAVAIETPPDATFGREAFQRGCWTAARALLGDAASADLDLSVVTFERAGPVGQAVVRTRRGETDRARAALACVDSVDGDPVGVRVTGTSGTVRACEEKLIQRPGEPERRTVAFEGTDRDAVAWDGRVDVATGSGYAGAATPDCQ